MFRKTVSGIMVTLLLAGMLTLVFNIQPVKASGTIYIRANGSIDPPTAYIATVDNVTYTFTGNINDSIVVERNSIVVDGAGFTVQGMGMRGIDLSYRSNVTIKDMNIRSCIQAGVFLWCSLNNSIFGNNITANYYGGIIGYNSNYCRIFENNVTNNGYGIYLYESSDHNSIFRNTITANRDFGIWPDYSSNNDIYENTIAGNNKYGGIRLRGGLNNSIFANNIVNNEYGMYLLDSSNNTVYHNNFTNNTQQIYDGAWDYPTIPPSINTWDDGYPSGGNYWSDYKGVDEYSGPYQNETGSDGIWDHKYVIDPNNVDRYPLARRSTHIIDVPFHYQITDYYCGPACLEMVFDYYGQDVSQLEIAEVARTHPCTTYTDELRRAAHFSNISTSKGTEMPENITGYTLRKPGYATFEQWSMTIDQLKTLLDKDSPIILLMWYSPKHVYGHYRVAIGYNDTHVILHDPWNNVDWGGLYGGPYLAFNYSTFLDLWQYSGYWGLFTCPWDIELHIPSNIWQGQNFTLTAKITYPCPAPFPNSSYPSSSCSATITLPNGLALVAGETNKKTLGSILPKGSANISWTIQAEYIGFYNITVEAEGKVAGSVGAHENFPTYNYEDRIGTSTDCTLEVRVIGDINDDFRVDIKDLVLVIKAYGSYPGHPTKPWNPNADINSDNKIDIKDLVLVIKHFGEHYP